MTGGLWSCEMELVGWSLELSLKGHLGSGWFCRIYSLKLIN